MIKKLEYVYLIYIMKLNNRNKMSFFKIYILLQEFKNYENSK